MERKVFLGIGAVVVRYLGRSDTNAATDRCLVVADLSMSQRTDYDDPSRWILVDLSRKLSGGWADAEYDDRGLTGSGDFVQPGVDPISSPVFGFRGTSLGDTWPAGASFGGLYVERSLFARLRDRIETRDHAWPPPGFDPGELTTVAYGEEEMDPAAFRRYLGIRARVVSVAGRVLTVQRLVPGNATLDASEPAFSVDLDDPAQCDATVPVDALGAGQPPLALLADATPVGGVGVVFVEMKYAYTQQISGPKIPFWMGQ